MVGRLTKSLNQSIWDQGPALRGCRVYAHKDFGVQGLGIRVGDSGFRF